MRLRAENTPNLNIHNSKTKEFRRKWQREKFLRILRRLQWYLLIKFKDPNVTKLENSFLDKFQLFCNFLNIKIVNLLFYRLNRCHQIFCER